MSRRGVGSGSRRAGRLGSGTFLETGVLRVKVAALAQTDLGASHHRMLSSFLVPKRNRAGGVCSLGEKPPTKLWGLGKDQWSSTSEHM